MLDCCFIRMLSEILTKAKLLVHGRDPQWIGGETLFTYRRSVGNINKISEIRIYDIISGSDISLLEVDQPSRIVSVWVPQRRPK